MALLVKLDENLPPSLVKVLARHGVEAATVKQQGWGGLPDSVLFPMVCEEGRFFITSDTGFANHLKYVPGTHPGILILSPDDENPQALARLLAAVLKTHVIAELEGYVVMAEDSGVRVQRPSAD